MVRGLSDLQAVGKISTLQYLFLQALKQVDKLPSLGDLHLLRRMHLETMKGLTDLKPVADAPSLEELIVVDMPQLQPEVFAPFVGHPTLKHITAGLGSNRKNQMVEMLLRLPGVNRGKNDFDFIE